MGFHEQGRSGRVEMWRGGLAMSLAVAGPFGCRCLTSSSMLRFHIPLIEPHVRIFRIRLSDWFHVVAHAGTPMCNPNLPKIASSEYRPIHRWRTLWRRLRVLLSIACSRHNGLPRNADGSAFATSLSRPAQDSLALQPVGLLAHPKHAHCPRGFGRVGLPVQPLG